MIKLHDDMKAKRAWCAFVLEAVTDVAEKEIVVVVEDDNDDGISGSDGENEE